MAVEKTVYAIETLKTTSDLRDYVRQHWGEPVRTTRNYTQYFARWRDDGTSPSFTVYASGFKDYGGQGISGSILDFVMHDRQCSFAEACGYVSAWLGGRGSIEPSMRKRALKRRRKPVAKLPSSAWQSQIARIITESHEQLRQQPTIVRYLKQGRGLMLATIEQAQLGWNPDWHHIHIEGERVSIAPGILIPWFQGETLAAVRIRLPLGSFSNFMGEAFRHHYAYLEGYDKYLSIKGSKLSSGLYYGNQIDQPDTTLITEGEFDALLAAQHLHEHNIAWQVITRGSASNYGNIPADILQGLQTCDHVYSLLDQDAAGIEATHILDRQLSNHRSLQLPEHNDITDYLVTEQGEILTLLAQILARRDRQGNMLQITSRMSPDPQFDTRGLPDGFIAGFTLATGGRSSLSLIAHHLITAAAQGQLPTTTDKETTGCTQKDLLKAVSIARSTLSRALPMLIQVGIVRELDPNESEEAISHQLTDKTLEMGGRPAQEYQISLDRIDLAAHLIEAIEARLLEHHFRDLPVIPHELLATQADLDKDLFEAWAALYEDILASNELYARWQAVQDELQGDGQWLGWRKLLYDEASDQFAFWSDYHQSDAMPVRLSDWREQFMQRLIRQNPTRFNADWRRLLGTLSAQTVYNTRDRLGYISDPNYASTEPITLDAKALKSHDSAQTAIAQALYRSASSLRGRVIRAECHVESFSRPVHYGFLGKHSEHLMHLMAQHRQELEAIVFVVQTASTYRLPTAEELEAKAAAEAIEKDIAAEDVSDATDQPVDTGIASPEQGSLPDDSIVTSLPSLEGVDAYWFTANLRLQYRLIVGWMPPDEWMAQEIIARMVGHYQAMSVSERKQQRQHARDYYQQHHAIPTAWQPTDVVREL